MSADSPRDPLAWTGGPPLVPAWCIDHAETEVVYHGHHLPVASPVPASLGGEDLDVARLARALRKVLSPVSGDVRDQQAESIAAEYASEKE